jgi:hypothetical protein
MFPKLITGLFLSLGLLFVGDGLADEKAAPDCSTNKMACCAKDKACCAASGKLSCCAKGMKCCGKNAGCCSAVQECCKAGASCCDEAKACCGMSAKTDAAKERKSCGGNSCCGKF